jgi:hypothetical protein
LLDEFISGLETLLNEATNRFVSEVTVGFSAHGGDPWQEPFVEEDWYTKFAKQGYGMLGNEKVVAKIERQLKETFPSIELEVNNSSDTWGTYNALVLSKFNDIDSAL